MCAYVSDLPAEIINDNVSQMSISISKQHLCKPVTNTFVYVTENVPLYIETMYV